MANAFKTFIDTAVGTETQMYTCPSATEDNDHWLEHSEHPGGVDHCQCSA